MEPRRPKTARDYALEAAAASRPDNSEPDPDQIVDATLRLLGHVSGDGESPLDRTFTSESDESTARPRDEVSGSPVELGGWSEPAVDALNAIASEAPAPSFAPTHDFAPAQAIDLPSFDVLPTALGAGTMQPGDLEVAPPGQDQLAIPGVMGRGALGLDSSAGFVEPGPGAFDDISPASSDLGPFELPGIAGSMISGNAISDASFATAAPGAEVAPTSSSPITTLPFRHGQRGTMRVLPAPLHPSDESHIQLLSGRAEAPGQATPAPPSSGLRYQEPTSDGGPPLSRPHFDVALAEGEGRRIIDDALAAVHETHAKEMKDISAFQIHEAFWERDCEERALW